LLGEDAAAVYGILMCSCMLRLFSTAEIDIKPQSSHPSPFTSSGISLVTSILNDQQSRPSSMNAETVRLPSPPLIEPRYGALSR